MKNKKKFHSGFTLIEILIVIGILAILAGVVLVAVNPARQFAQARDAQRLSNVNAILNAIGQNIAENRGLFKCDGEVVGIPEDPGKTIKAPEGSDGIDLYQCLVPIYLANLSFDPTDGSMTNPPVNYDTAYAISATGTRITVSAPFAELEEISVTR